MDRPYHGRQPTAFVYAKTGDGNAIAAPGTGEAGNAGNEAGSNTNGNAAGSIGASGNDPNYAGGTAGKNDYAKNNNAKLVMLIVLLSPITILES